MGPQQVQHITIHLPNYAAAADRPPSYDSVFGVIKQAREDSDSVLDFLRKFVIIIAGTIGCSVCLAIFLSIPISCIVIGVKYKDDCPIQSKIPLYLIVLGSFGILRNLIGLCNQAKRYMDDEDDDEDESYARKSSAVGIIDCFLIAWFICGNVWVYANYEPNYHDQSSPRFCHEVLYKFAFWLITSGYIFVGTICCCSCCISLCAGLIPD